MKQRTWKKTAAFALALTLVAVAVPANTWTGGLFGNTAIVASAANTPVYTAPTAKTMVYTGDPQALVNAGSVTEGGTMEYTTDVRKSVAYSQNSDITVNSADLEVGDILYVGTRDWGRIWFDGTFICNGRAYCGTPTKQ